MKNSSLWWGCGRLSKIKVTANYMIIDFANNIIEGYFKKTALIMTKTNQPSVMVRIHLPIKKSGTISNPKRPGRSRHHKTR